jgi:hypothetical protein
MVTALLFAVYTVLKAAAQALWLVLKCLAAAVWHIARFPFYLARKIAGAFRHG